jgi:hypothetical protein
MTTNPTLRIPHVTAYKLTPVDGEQHYVDVGKVIYRYDPPNLVEAIGEHLQLQNIVQPTRTVLRVIPKIVIRGIHDVEFPTKKVLQHGVPDASSDDPPSRVTLFKQEHLEPGTVFGDNKLFRDIDHPNYQGKNPWERWFGILDYSDGNNTNMGLEVQSPTDVKRVDDPIKSISRNLRTEAPRKLEDRKYLEGYGEIDNYTLYGGEIISLGKDVRSESIMYKPNHNFGSLNLYLKDDPFLPKPSHHTRSAKPRTTNGSFRGTLFKKAPDDLDLEENIKRNFSVVVYREEMLIEVGEGGRNFQFLSSNDRLNALVAVYDVCGPGIDTPWGEEMNPV